MFHSWTLKYVGHIEQYHPCVPVIREALPGLEYGLPVNLQGIHIGMKVLMRNVGRRSHRSRADPKELLERITAASSEAAGADGSDATVAAIAPAMTLRLALQ